MVARPWGFKSPPEHHLFLMDLPIIQLCSALLYTAAALCLFLMLLNRVMIIWPDSKAKGMIIPAVFLITTGSAATTGFILPWSPWVYGPALVLLLIAAGEVRLVFLRRAYAGSGPINSKPHAVNLTSPVTTTDCVTHRYEMEHMAWQGERLRVVQITDIHAHPDFPLEYYQRIFDIAGQANPDLVVFTGDFITSLDSLDMLSQILRPVGKAVNIAVLGNHDYWAGADPVRQVIKKSGLKLLTEESINLSIRGQNVLVTGHDYPWGRRNRTIPPRGDAVLHVILSHTPDNIFRLAAAAADIVFSGHCHAGQIRIPFLGPIVVPSIYGRLFDHGHFIINGSHLFVASGIGASLPPVRIYCQPDIFIVDVVAKGGGSASLRNG